MSEVVHLVAVLGRGVVDPDEPVVTADDLGLTRGDGCFDSARVITDAAGHASVVDLDDHLDRLAASAATMDIPDPTREQWRGLVAQALAAWSTPGEAVLKLLLTRGREWQPDPRPDGPRHDHPPRAAPAHDATGRRRPSRAPSPRSP